MLVGEAPGREEDMQARALCRPLRPAARSHARRHRPRPRTGVYIANVVPVAAARQPHADAGGDGAVPAFIRRQIALVDPDFLICLGGAAASGAARHAREGVLRPRGQWLPYHTGTRPIRAMATLHPAYLLRQPARSASSGAISSRSRQRSKPTRAERTRAHFLSRACEQRGGDRLFDLRCHDFDERHPTTRGSELSLVPRPIRRQSVIMASQLVPVARAPRMRGRPYFSSPGSARTGFCRSGGSMESFTTAEPRPDRHRLGRLASSPAASWCRASSAASAACPRLWRHGLGRQRRDPAQPALAVPPICSGSRSGAFSASASPARR